MSMQQDAVRRVREMQRIANSKLEGRQEPSSSEQHIAASGQPGHAPTPSRQAARDDRQKASVGQESGKLPASSENGLLSGLLGQLNLDRDRLIILLLLIVLMNEGTDQKLLLALCYLLL